MTTAALNEEDTRRWQAVLRKDARFDGSFVYAVRSTGVYCRPSCPSRRPRREQVEFFGQPQGAERAGFRPCLRCRPRERNAQLALVERACAHIRAHAEETLRLADVARAAGASPHHLQRTFKRLLGVSPRQYADALRLEAVKSELRNGRDVTSALYEAGYGASSRLYERAPKQIGMTPASYRRGGPGARIAYDVRACALGRILVAATERGLCAVRLGGSDAELEKGLRQEYPAAELRRDERRLGEWTGAILRQLDGEPPAELPLDVRATAFQRRVWEELKAIPYGATRSYGAVAKAMGQPRAARAVARACASNPVALVIPCHRVVRGDGSPGGYRWGAQRKQALLRREADRKK